ncbi:MAG: acyl-CoA dehydratase activase [Desulfobacteraceae bacterium]|jgi:predicted CoA-substrate-specific enzyme activase
MRSTGTILGIDIGSSAYSVVRIAPSGDLTASCYGFHHGDPEKALKQVLEPFDLSSVGGIAATASTPASIKATRRYDNRVAVMAAARRFYPQARSIVIIGAEKFGLIQLDPQGNYRTFRANTGCAAGTGSFLDQQALRLKLENSAALAALAQRNAGAIPKIASRCAVFAKTDLAHAQQEGYRLEQICDGLCYGLARNVVDVLFSGQTPLGPVLLTGGVANNLAVAGHIRDLIGLELIVAQHPCEAVGAALCLLPETTQPQLSPPMTVETIVIPQSFEKQLCHDPIELTLSDYPVFTSRLAYAETRWDPVNPVEVDLYEDLTPFSGRGGYLGVDIGSTSTKAVLMTTDGIVLAGFYTRTAGKPVKATQNLLAAIAGLLETQDAAVNIKGVATTGSGRKFAGRIVGADLILDEITAHAKAAVALNPAVDTIIEIGGQDSKFTTLQQGRVTFSNMNAVCAAGTGSFIEEQAQKLGCTLERIAPRTEHRRSPLASERCTVFMERDINHYLTNGYTVDEVLAAVLHSVVENYLSKVANESSIGTTITFQGATAKNRSLVAAMEQRLQKPLFVSRFCHLTGAMGCALALAEQGTARTGFKGLDLFKHKIPIRSETCELCTNHCKISVADVRGHETAYGFLCGRDYQTPKRVSLNRTGFDLLAERQKAFGTTRFGNPPRSPAIGLPAALHLVEDLPLWQHFFHSLGFATVTSTACTDAVKTGKPLAGAPFCGPIMALCGHVSHLLSQCDYLFLPFYLEQKASKKSVRRQYCYYTQFAPCIASCLPTLNAQKKLLKPLILYLYNELVTKRQLHRMLNVQLGRNIGFIDVSAAYDAALAFGKAAQIRLKGVYQRHRQASAQLHAVLLGRPYTVLVPAMNKGILDIFAALGVKTFYQDMLTYTPEEVRSIEPLTDEIHWHYAARILEAAEVTARAAGAYPVLVTAFNCTPDSFVIDYFKKVMAAHNKPYLILQLDEHDSNVGYETRIEAAIAAFRSHHIRHTQSVEKAVPAPIPALLPRRAGALAEKTLLFPNWDETAQRLVVANLQREGFDARLLRGSDAGMRKSMRFNNGQCIPLNIIAQAFIDYMADHDLDPGRTALWIGRSKIACNIGLYAFQIQSILQSHGNGVNRAEIYTGRLSLADISMKLPVNTYLAYMFGGLLKKMGCRVRPYERVAGATDQVLRKSLALLETAFRFGRSKEAALAQVVEWFEGIECRRADREHRRPKVAIFGDLYVRDNDVINQELIHFIEAQGGEVVTTPYSAYVKMIAQPYRRKWFVEGLYLQALSSKAFIATITRLERTYYKYFQRILKEPEPVYDESPEQILSTYGIRIENTGETMENILKIHYLKKYHPDIALFVQASPAFCCPSQTTAAMAAVIEKVTHTPMVDITYDGTGGSKNDVITPYLKFPR